MAFFSPENCAKIVFPPVAKCWAAKKWVYPSQISPTSGMATLGFLASSMIGNPGLYRGKKGGSSTFGERSAEIRLLFDRSISNILWEVDNLYIVI